MQVVNRTTRHFGVDIPRLGLGTRGLNGMRCVDEIRNALSLGYRYIETAQNYHNEKQVGQAIREAQIPRNELFVSTKVWIDDVKPYDLLWSVRESLDRLRLEQVDLLLLHWPNPKFSLQRTIEAMNEAKERKLVKHLGVANFTSKLFRKACKYSENPLICNEIEYHPLINQQMIIESAREKGAAIIAYGPTADGEALNYYEITRIAFNHGKTKSQIIMRWLIQQEGVVALPRITRRTTYAECADIFDFELSEDEMTSINRLRSENRRIFDPDYAPNWEADSMEEDINSET